MPVCTIKCSKFSWLQLVSNSSKSALKVKKTTLKIKIFLREHAPKPPMNNTLTPQNLSIEICVPKIFSIHIYVKIALTKKKKKKKLKKFHLLGNYFFVTYMSHTVLKGV